MENLQTIAKSSVLAKQHRKTGPIPDHSQPRGKPGFPSSKGSNKALQYPYQRPLPRQYQRRQGTQLEFSSPLASNEPPFPHCPSVSGEIIWNAWTCTPLQALTAVRLSLPTVVVSGEVLEIHNCHYHPGVTKPPPTRCQWRLGGWNSYTYPSVMRRPPHDVNGGCGELGLLPPPGSIMRQHSLSLLE